MPVLATQTPLEFFSTVALLLPVLFVGTMVELGFSASVPGGEAERPSRVASRAFAAYLAVLGFLTGEIAAVRALWEDGHSRGDGSLALLGVAVSGAVFVLRFSDRVDLAVTAGGDAAQRRLKALMRGLIVVMWVAGVVLIVVGRYW